LASRGTATRAPRSCGSTSRQARPGSSASPTLSRGRRPRCAKGGCPIRWRSVWLTACSVVVAAVAGCGGGDGETRTERTQPQIERAVAEQLAGTSDEVAAAIESGDSCAASDAAARLRADLTDAINGGKVPDVYLEDLSGAVNELAAQVPACADEPSAGNDDDDDRDHDGKEKGKGKGKSKKDKGGPKHRDTGEGETVPTEPETETETLPPETVTDPTTTGTDTSEGDDG
jgi:hypothetical protein